MKYPAIIFVIYQREKVIYFSNKNAITLMRIENGKKVDWDNLCIIVCVANWINGTNTSRILRGTILSMLVNLDLGKKKLSLFFQQKNSPYRPYTRVKKTKKKMQATFKNKRKFVAKSPRSVFKRKIKIEKGGASRSRVKKNKKTKKQGLRR